MSRLAAGGLANSGQNRQGTPTFKLLETVCLVSDLLTLQHLPLARAYGEKIKGEVFAQGGTAVATCATHEPALSHH